MNKMIKACLFAAAFAFVAGCSTHETPANETHNDTISNTAAHGKMKCKKHHGKCMGKLGVEKTKEDTTK